MPYCPVIAFERRKQIIKRLIAMQIPVDQIARAAVDGETALDTLWTREKTIRSLTRLTGQPRHLLDMWDTGELQEIEQRTLRNLMGARPGDDRLIYSMPGQMARTRRDRRTQANRAWGLTA